MLWLRVQVLLSAPQLLTGGQRKPGCATGNRDGPTNGVCVSRPFPVTRTNMVSVKQADKWFGQWVEVLNLQAWEFTCVWVDAPTVKDDEESVYWGHCQADRRNMAATITIALDRSPVDVRTSIVHELLHVALAEWDDVVKAAKSYVPAALYTHLGEDAYDAQERVVNLLERVLTKFATAKK